MQTIASNAIIRGLPRIEKLASEKSLSALHLAYTVKFTVSCLRIDIIDLHDKSMWKEGYEYYYEDALKEAEDINELEPPQPPIMVVEVRYPRDNSDSEESYSYFMFSERFPTYDRVSDTKTGRATCSCGEAMNSNHNQLYYIVDCVRDWVREEVRDSEIDQGWWTKEIVDVFVREVDKVYGPHRDIIGQPTNHDDAYGEFLS